LVRCIIRELVDAILMWINRPTAFLSEKLGAEFFELIDNVCVRAPERRLVTVSNCNVDAGYHVMS